MIKNKSFPVAWMWMVCGWLAVTCGVAAGQANGDGGGVEVFRIGSFDRSALEFDGGRPSKPVVYVAGGATLAKGWFARQEAVNPGEEKESGPAAPRVIQFELNEAPAAAYRLHIAVLLESLSVPALRVEVNGTGGTFYMDSHLDAAMGGMDDSSESRLAPVDLEIPVPGGMLRKGTNTIRLTVVRTPEDTVAASNMTYDAIELDSVAANDQESAARVVPTIFYQQAKGQLEEAVHVFVRCSDRCAKGQAVVLTVGGTEYRGSFESTENFGEERVQFLVPEFASGAAAHVAWTTASGMHDADQTLTPEKKWTLLIVPHIHLDIGYSDFQAKVAAIQSRALDEALAMAVKHPEYKFSTDGSWNLAQFMKTRTESDQQRLIAAMKDRQVSVPAEYANLLTEFPTAEVLIRSLYYSANFSRVHGTPFDYADLTDVPSHAWAYASILASAGIHYFAAGPNGAEWRAPVLLGSHLNERSPFWWQGPDGQKVLAWYSRHYQEMEVFFGRPPTIPAGEQTLPLLFKAYERPGYTSDNVILYGSQVENTDLFPQQAELAGEWNAIHAYPKLVYSDYYDALRLSEKQTEGNIPTVDGGGGGYWEDGIASDARGAAMERANESRAPSVEKLATVASLVNPMIAADKARFDSMWDNMVMMDEHTWTAHNAYVDPDGEEAISQLAVKDQYALHAQADADWLARNNMADLADDIAVEHGSLVVFNTLNWARSGEVEFDLNKGNEVFDPTTDQVVPVEVLKADPDLSRVRFLARDVPAMGYKVFALRRATATPAAMEEKHTSTLENRFYRVELDAGSGAIRSIYDKALKRELVNEKNPYTMGEYVYVSGGDHRPNGVLLYQPHPIDPQLNVTTAHDGRIVSVSRTPTGMVATMESTAMNTPTITTQVRLFDEEKKIELVEDVDKTEVHKREAVYFAFPFQMDRPQFQYEIADGVIDPAKDIYKGGDQEWFTVQHWVSVQQDGMSATLMPLDAPLVTLGDINRGMWPKDFGVRAGNIFSYAMNNYWNTNYVGGQGGHFEFRYMITSAAKTDAVALSREGWEEMTPLEKDEVKTQDKAVERPLPFESKQMSLMHVEDGALLLEDWKPAEDGNGTIARFLDLGGEARAVTVEVPFLTLRRVVQTDAVERDGQALALKSQHAFTFAVKPHEIVTMRLIGMAEPAGEAKR